MNGLISNNLASYLTTKQVAQVTGFTEKALGSMRNRREGPRYFKVGRLVRYRTEDIKLWIEQGRSGS